MQPLLYALEKSSGGNVNNFVFRRFIVLFVHECELIFQTNR